MIETAQRQHEQHRNTMETEHKHDRNPQIDAEYKHTGNIIMTIQIQNKGIIKTAQTEQKHNRDILET